MKSEFAQGQDWRELGQLGQRVTDEQCSFGVQGQDWRELGQLGQRVADKWCSLGVQGQDWRETGRLGQRVADERCSVGCPGPGLAWVRVPLSASGLVSGAPWVSERRGSRRRA